VDLTLLRSFLTVVEHGGVTEAAHTLAVSQSALSRRLAQLSEEFGVALFERAGRGVVLTPLGRLVAEEAKGLTQRYDGVKRRVRDHLELQAGIVRIGGGATAVAFLLPEQIADYRKQHPKVVFQLKEAGSRDTEDAVLRGDLELGVVTLPVRSQDLVVKPWIRDRIVLVGSKEHRLARRKRVSAADLEGETVVGFEAGTAVRRLVDRALDAAGVHLNVAMELRSVAAILQMVDATQSLAFVSELALGRARAAIPVSGLNIERQLALVWRADRALSPASARFCELLAPGQ
jgi:DNA-binding transcriptional LysR family regulator